MTNMVARRRVSRQLGGAVSAVVVTAVVVTAVGNTAVT
jgi:hypothetical protein